MNYLDWTVIVVYVITLLTLSRYIGKHQNNLNDYYLGGQKLSWWAVGLSTMATQLGAISFISAPAFVALKPGGGLTWLGYEFAVPAAMIFVMIFIVPVIHGSSFLSIYEYLEHRFDASTRTIVSLIFQISRALATGVGIYAIGIVLSAIWEIPLIHTVLLIGAITIIYDVWGGMKAVIYSDVIQMIVLTIGILICGIAAIYLLGGVEDVFSSVDQERLKIMDVKSTGLGDGNDFSFWALLFGGFFLYVSYYGCDQSQLQREMSAKDLDTARKSLMFNGFVRFFLVVSYLAMGLLIGAFAFKNPEFMALIPKDNVDYMVPVFVINYLPHGLIGLIVVALLAAFMSSLDSSINSLSAATMNDLYKRHLKPRETERHYVLWSRILTVFWGVVCTGFAFVVGNISDTVIEAINKVGSLFYGPVLAAFMLGILFKRTSATGTKLGVLLGVGINFVLWIWFPDVSWLWWNVAGTGIAMGVGYLWSVIYPADKANYISWHRTETDPKWTRKYIAMAVYFLSIIALSYIAQVIWLG